MERGGGGLSQDLKTLDLLKCTMAALFKETRMLLESKPDTFFLQYGYPTIKRLGKKFDTLVPSTVKLVQREGEGPNLQGGIKGN